MKISLALVAAFALSIAPALAAEGRYRRCVALAARDAAAALAEAKTWEAEGGAGAARHCAALAMTAKGDYEAAAAELLALADDVETKPAASSGAIHAADALRAELLAQAGNAWFLAGKWAPARDAFGRALDALPERSPMRAGILIDRARAFAAEGAEDRALSDLDAALEADPARADAYVLRASLYRKRKQAALAKSDVDAALALDPGDLDALFERGVERALAGDAAGAAEDWAAVAAKAASPLAEAASANLKALEDASDPAPAVSHAPAPADHSARTPSSVSDPE